MPPSICGRNGIALRVRFADAVLLIPSREWSSVMEEAARLSGPGGAEWHDRLLPLLGAPRIAGPGPLPVGDGCYSVAVTFGKAVGESLAELVAEGERSLAEAAALALNALGEAAGPGAAAILARSITTGDQARASLAASALIALGAKASAEVPGSSWPMPTAVPRSEEPSSAYWPRSGRLTACCRASSPWRFAGTSQTDSWKSLTPSSRGASRTLRSSVCCRRHSGRPTTRLQSGPARTLLARSSDAAAAVPEIEELLSRQVGALSGGWPRMHWQKSPNES